MEEVMKHLRSRYNIIANMKKLEDFSLAQQVLQCSDGYDACAVFRWL